jgi:hypothetical protein
MLINLYIWYFLVTQQLLAVLIKTVKEIQLGCYLQVLIETCPLTVGLVQSLA